MACDFETVCVVWNIKNSIKNNIKNCRWQPGTISYGYPNTLQRFLC